jgi:hypothetical protein
MKHQSRDMVINSMLSVNKHFNFFTDTSAIILTIGLAASLSCLRTIKSAFARSEGDANLFSLGALFFCRLRSN